MNYYCEQHFKYFKDLSALNMHLNSKAHESLYCHQHNRGFKMQKDFDQHLNSAAHSFKENSNIHDSYKMFRCENHKRNFTSKSALDMHLKDIPHELKFRCNDHKRNYPSQKALQDHMKSPCHSLRCDKHNQIFKKYEDFQQHLRSSKHPEFISSEKEEFVNEKSILSYKEELDIPPPFEGIKGKWVRPDLIPEHLLNKTSFGFFKCFCKRTWISAYAQSIWRQGCKSCVYYSYPKLMWINDDKNEKKDFSETPPHLDKLCEACYYGVCPKSKN